MNPGATTSGGDRPFRAERRAARLAAVQALYQLDIGAARTEAVVDEFCRHRLDEAVRGAGLAPADRELFAGLVRTAATRRDEIDALIVPWLAAGWSLPRLNATMRGLLRAAVAELLSRPDIPARVTISEFVDVAHGFFAGDEPGFVNGILDRVARRLRGAELNGGNGGQDPGRR